VIFDNSYSRVPIGTGWDSKLRADERELPHHPFAGFVVDVAGVADVPPAGVLPPADGELVEERDGDVRSGCVEEGTVRGVEFLIAAAPRTGVFDRARGFAEVVRVARVDPAEIGEQRDEEAAA
jgi:hypothetical protein